MNDDIQVKIDATTSGNAELTIRHGQAMTLKDPAQVKISGQIFAPSEFYIARKHLFQPLGLEPSQPGTEVRLNSCIIDNVVTYNSDATIVTMNREKGQVFLFIDENNPYRHIIDGTLEENPIIADLQLNQDTYLEPKDLAKKLRKWRHCASSVTSFDEVCKNLMSFKGEFTTEFDKSNDKKGGVANSIVRKLTSQHKLDFDMKFEIFKNTPAVSLSFLTEIDYTDKGVLICTLYVPELEGAKENIKEGVFERIQADFEGLTILHI